MSSAIAAQASKSAEETEVPGGRGRKRMLPRGHDERVFEICDCVIDLAAAFFNLPSRELRGPGRGTDEISRVRQIAMYVTHVVLGLTMADIGKGFGRDRSTVVHACHLVEDLRDDDDFDRVIARAECIVAAAFRGRLPL